MKGASLERSPISLLGINEATALARWPVETTKVFSGAASTSPDHDWLGYYLCHPITYPKHNPRARRFREELRDG